MFGLILIIALAIIIWWQTLGSYIAKMADKTGSKNIRFLAWVPVVRHYLMADIADIPALGVIYVLLDIPKWLILIISIIISAINPIVIAFFTLLDWIILFLIAKRFKAYFEFLILVVISIVYIYIVQQLLPLKTVILETKNIALVLPILIWYVVAMLVELWMYKLISNKNPNGYVDGNEAKKTA